jgi:hypothetical protein
LFPFVSFISLSCLYVLQAEWHFNGMFPSYFLCFFPFYSLCLSFVLSYICCKLNNPAEGYLPTDFSPKSSYERYTPAWTTKDRNRIFPRGCIFTNPPSSRHLVCRIKISNFEWSLNLHGMQPDTHTHTHTHTIYWIWWYVTTFVDVHNSKKCLVFWWVF